MSLIKEDHVLKRLLKKRTALFSILFLFLLFLSSLFAYFLITDNTPNSNNQLLEISLKRPGFSTDLLMS